jgi:type IV secretory pathway TrbF-like protein
MIDYGKHRRHSMMRILTIALVGLTLCLAANGQAAASPAKVKKVTISGRVTNDGAAIAVGARRLWSVANAEMLRGHAGEYVTVRGVLNSVTGKVEVWSFRLASTQTPASAHLGDSAFRR